MIDLSRYASYNYRMKKRAISVTLDPENLLWLRAQTVTSGCRSVSEVLDRLIRYARSSKQVRGEALRSVVGTVRIAEYDPDLSTADAAIRALFPPVSRRRPGSMRSKTPAKKAVQHPIPGGQKRA